MVRSLVPVQIACCMTACLLFIGCAGPTTSPSATLPGATLTTQAPWTASAPEAPESNTLFILRDASRQMAGRIQLLPSFEQREALLVWLMLDLQDRGVTTLEDPLAAASIFDTNLQDVIWTFPDPSSPQFQREYIVHHTPDGTSLLFEMVGPEDMLAASRQERIALYKTLELPAPKSTEQPLADSSCSRDVKEPGLLHVRCPDKLLSIERRELSLPYATTREDLTEQFKEESSQGHHTGVIKIIVTLPDADKDALTLERVRKQSGPLVEMTHLYRWQVEGTSVTMIAASIPTLLIAGEEMTLLEQCDALTQGEP